VLASTLACATAADTLVTIALCTCRRELYSHRPDGRFADALAFTLAWQLWPTLLSTTVCTCHRDLEISHRPHGRLTFCSLFAGRRCLGRAGWHSDHLIVHDQWEHSKRGAHSCSKFPICPMGDSSFARCLQGGGVAVFGGTVSIVNSQIYSNTAPLGAGVYVASSTSVPAVTITSSLITGNTANSASSGGGGVIVSGGRVAISSCTISGNTASQGGGVTVYGGTVTISSCTISGNTAGLVRAHPQKFPMPRWESC
jgi:hypothetical protein